MTMDHMGRNAKKTEAGDGAVRTAPVEVWGILDFQSFCMSSTMIYSYVEERVAVPGKPGVRTDSTTATKRP